MTVEGRPLIVGQVITDRWVVCWWWVGEWSDQEKELREKWLEWKAVSESSQFPSTQTSKVLTTTNSLVVLS